MIEGKSMITKSKLSDIEDKVREKSWTARSKLWRAELCQE
jgi:hypothetical protein